MMSTWDWKARLELSDPRSNAAICMLELDWSNG